MDSQQQQPQQQQQQQQQQHGNNDNTTEVPNDPGSVISLSFYSTQFLVFSRKRTRCKRPVTKSNNMVEMVLCVQFCIFQLIFRAAFVGIPSAKLTTQRPLINNVLAYQSEVKKLLHFPLPWQRLMCSRPRRRRAWSFFSFPGAEFCLDNFAFQKRPTRLDRFLWPPLSPNCYSLLRPVGRIRKKVGKQRKKRPNIFLPDTVPEGDGHFCSTECRRFEALSRFIIAIFCCRIVGNISLRPMFFFSTCISISGIDFFGESRIWFTFSVLKTGSKECGHQPGFPWWNALDSVKCRMLEHVLPV